MAGTIDPVTSNTSDRPTEAILGIGYALLVSAQQTGGAYELMKFVVPPGAGPPPHIHQNEEEAFLLMDGDLEVQVGDQTIRAEQGTHIHLPRGVPHGFRNVSDRPASFLCWVVPGNLAGFFDAFRQPWSPDAEQPLPVNEEDIGKMMATAPKYGIEILGGQ